MLERLKEFLSQRRKSHLIDQRLTPSAVLVPIYYKQGQYYVILIQRTERVKEHKGQISFPGGAYEEKDGTLWQTALRESAEEIGLAVESVALLGELDDFVTTTSGYIITPFVAAIPWPSSLRVDEWETAEIVEVPLSALLDKNFCRQETEIIDGQSVTAYFYHYQGRVIWGATARILNQFLGIWSQVTPNDHEATVR